MSPSTYRGTRSFSVHEPLICKILGRGVIFRGTQKTTLWHNLLVLDMNWKNYLSATKPLVEAQRGPTGNQNLGSCQAYIPRIIYFSGFKYTYLELWTHLTEWLVTLMDTLVHDANSTFTIGRVQGEQIVLNIIYSKENTHQKAREILYLEILQCKCWKLQKVSMPKAGFVGP